jgi:hypothetical protein
MNDCGDCVQTAASGEVGGRLLRSLMIFGNSPVIAEPSHKGPRFGLRIAIILTTISHRLQLLIEGIISLVTGCSHSLATLHSTSGSQNVPHKAEDIA